MRHFKPRYSLATMMGMFTVVAFLLWAVPAWRAYQEARQRRLEFEEAFREIRVVMPRWPHNSPLNSAAIQSQLTEFVDANEDLVRARAFFFDDAIYCIYMQTKLLGPEQAGHEFKKWMEMRAAAGVEDLSFNPFPIARLSQIYVYRLEPNPRGYQQRSRDARRKQGGMYYREAPYLIDFYKHIAGREPTDMDIKHRLIHADPPLSTE